MRKFLKVSLGWLSGTATILLLAPLLRAQTLPAGCTPASDGGYTCTDPSLNNGEQSGPSGPASDTGIQGAPLGASGNGGRLTGTSPTTSSIVNQAAALGQGGLLTNEAALSKASGVLGLTAGQLSKLRGQLALGAIGPDELQQLCVRLASKHISDADVDEIVHSLDITLGPDQLAQLKSCTEIGKLEKPTAPQEAVPSHRGLPGKVRSTTGDLSSIEKAFEGLDSGAPPEEPSAELLTQYGYSLFSSPVSTFAPVSDVPVSVDYLVGPGDELKILMWGRINSTYDLQVGRDGTIAIAGIGPLQVAGLTFSQAKRLIEERAGQITGVQVDVTMGRLRTIQVFIIGEVDHPGPYTVSALSHVSNVLVASGGISKIGSLRKIELRRGNQLVRVIDLYDVLMRGNTTADEQLQQNDVIFVPVIGPVAAIAGDVKRPAIYELHSVATDLMSVIKLAGGISAFGYSQRVQVERVENHKRRSVLDINLDQLRSQQFEINDGDLIKVYPVLPQQNEIVAVSGNVNRPGKYEWREGMKVGDLIREAEGLAPRTFMRYAVIRREQEPNKVVHLLPVDLGAALSDHLSGPANIALNSKDELTVFSLDQIRDLPTVQVFGEVRNPGFYLMSPEMRVSDLVYLAGGLKDAAYLAGAEVARTQVVNGTNTRHLYMDVDLRAALDGSGDHNPVLEPNDQLFVWRAPGWHLPWVVQVSGEVSKPGPYTVHQGEHLASLLMRCGGMLPNAYLPGTVFTRQSVKQLEQKSLEESRDRLRKQIAQMELMPVQAGQTDSTRSAQTLAYVQQVLDQSEGQQASGRMVLRMRPIDQLENSPDNVLLEDRDQIVIPRRPSSVSVLGQVYHPTAIVYEPPLTARDYLDRAGGPSEGADTDHLFVVKADGSVLTEDGVENSGRARIFPLLPVFSGGLMGTHLDPGDTVYVPQKLIFTSDLQYAKDITQIIASTIQSVAIFGLLATKL